MQRESLFSNLKHWKKHMAFLASGMCMLMLMSVNVLAAEEEAAEVTSHFYATPWALLPPVIAIGLALLTKEVYSSLFIGQLM